MNFLMSTISAAVSKSLWPGENVERFSQRLDKISTKEDMVLEYRSELLRKHKSDLFESWLASGKPDPRTSSAACTMNNEQQDSANPFPVGPFDDRQDSDDELTRNFFTQDFSSPLDSPSHITEGFARKKPGFEGASRGVAHVMQKTPVITEDDITALQAAKEAARLRRKARISGTSRGEPQSEGATGQTTHSVLAKNT